jgi:hypothetical protein
VSARVLMTIRSLPSVIGAVNALVTEDADLLLLGAHGSVTITSVADSRFWQGAEQGRPGAPVSGACQHDCNGIHNARSSDQLQMDPSNPDSGLRELATDEVDGEAHEQNAEGALHRLGRKVLCES